MTSRNTTRISLWSGPRNISTALMYAFAQRADTKVFDEPLYAYYLSQTKAKDYHPGAKEIMASQNTNGETVVRQMLTDQSKPVLFYKNMTHHLLNLDKAFMKSMVNLILTREPKEMITSFAKVIPNPTMEDIGYKAHIDLITYFNAENIEYVVLDAKKVLLNPRKVLTQLCEIINIPFHDAMLNWPPGARAEDGVWAKYWYANVHKSSGFSKYKPKIEPFPEHLNTLLADSQAYYQKLKAISIG